MSDTATKFDQAYAEAQLAEVRVKYEKLRQEPLSSTAMVDYHIHNLTALEVWVRLWERVVEDGHYHGAAGRVGEYITSLGDVLQSNIPTKLVELRAATVWWRNNKRRALAESGDPELFVLVMI